MIVGIGIDMVRIARIERWMSQERLLSRCFDDEELAYARGRLNPVESLAANYAAKEAFSKAIGTGLRGLSMHDMLLRRNEAGRPELKFAERAQKCINSVGGQHVYISLTHEGDYACAVVVIEGERSEERN